MLKQNLCANIFRDDREVDSVVTRRLITKETDCYQQRIQKLAPRYDKCHSCDGDYVEKQRCSCEIKCEMLWLKLKIGNPKYMKSELIL